MASVTQQDQGSTPLARELQTERRVMAAELAWLLTVYCPPVIKTLSETLRSSAATLLPGQPFNLALASPLQDPSVKGSISLQGHFVTGVDVTIKTASWHKGNPYRVQLAPPNRIVLDQMLDARHYIERAVQSLESLGKPPFRAERLEDALLSASQDLTRALDGCHGIGGVAVPLRVAHRALRAQSCQPPLPDDLHIEFAVSKSRLVVTIALLHTVPATSNSTIGAAMLARAASVASGNSVPKRPDRGGQFIRHQNRLVEVQHLTSCDTLIPNLDAQLRTVRRALAWCRNLQRKLQLVRDSAATCQWQCQQQLSMDASSHGMTLSSTPAAASPERPPPVSTMATPVGPLPSVLASPRLSLHQHFDQNTPKTPVSPAFSRFDDRAGGPSMSLLDVHSSTNRLDRRISLPAISTSASDDALAAVPTPQLGTRRDVEPEVEPTLQQDNEIIPTEENSKKSRRPLSTVFASVFNSR